MADQKLTSEVEIKGAEKGAQQLKGVADAQKGVTGQVEEAAKGADKATEAQQKLSASESDFIGVLSRINPMLGGLVDSLFKSSKIAGDLASANINLTNVFGKLSGAVKVNAATLKLIGAGGAVALAIWAITRAVKAMREEFERATSAIKAQVDALTELRGQQREQQQVLENLADQRGEGGYGTPDEARAAAQRVQQVGQHAPYLDEPAIMQAVAMASAERSTADLERIALAISSGRLELEPGAPPVARERAIERALNRYAEVLDKTVSREQAQRRELYGEAADQMQRQAGGSLDALIKVVEQATRGEGFDSMRLAQGLQVLADARALSETSRFKGKVGTGLPWTITMGDVVARAAKDAGVALEGGGLSEKEFATVEGLERLIRSQAETAEKLERAAELQAAHPPVTNNYHNQFSRNTYPDAASQRRNIRNGETRAREIERL
ncbi:MAG: hypothetical protein WBE26_04570 [Phycisphaerae bacterium]